MKTDDKRAGQREALVTAAEQIIAAQGLEGLKARDLATSIGCSVGGVYNLVDDLDELILRVAARTLLRLNEALDAADQRGAAAPTERLCAIAIAYCRFARANKRLWRALFDHRMAADAALPQWLAELQFGLFTHITGPLGQLLPEKVPAELEMLSRTLFSAVHGVVAIGLDEKLLAVPIDALEDQLVAFLQAMCRGLRQS